MDDTELIGRAAAGDDDAFELIVRRHTEAAWRLARSMLSDDFAAEEAVQDAFVKAYRGVGSFRGEAQVKTWLMAICRRACLDRLRRRMATVVPLDRIKERRAASASPELRLAIEDAMAGLPEDERTAFVLVHVLDYSRSEAADICGVPASTMRSRVSRARRRLASTLAAGDAEERGS